MKRLNQQQKNQCIGVGTKSQTFQLKVLTNSIARFSGYDQATNA